MKKSILALCALSFLAPATISAHCQVPCGIFDNDNVIGKMHTDFETIEKASAQIVELSKDFAANHHQITRWIMQKEEHAQAIQDTVSKYFLAQRIKTDEEDKEAYLAKLTLCHQTIVAAMKCKQSTDEAGVKTLHDLLHGFEKHFGTK
jgi:nickel superoxide dismutase